MVHKIQPTKNNNSKPLRHIVPNVYPKKFKQCFCNISSFEDKSIFNIRKKKQIKTIIKNVQTSQSELESSFWRDDCPGCKTTFICPRV